MKGRTISDPFHPSVLRNRNFLTHTNVIRINVGVKGHDSLDRRVMALGNPGQCVTLSDDIRSVMFGVSGFRFRRWSDRGWRSGGGFRLRRGLTHGRLVRLRLCYIGLRGFRCRGSLVLALATNNAYRTS